MTNKTTDSSQASGGDDPPPSEPAPAPEDNAQPDTYDGNKVYKSGPLFLSSKRGIGWTFWKKRWFILTRISLVFFRSDPNAAPPKGSEVNLALGGIDLNSSGSVVVKADKKLLTVHFADGRDGKPVTLKAETSEDLSNWKAALEEALANAPSAAGGIGQGGVLKNDQPDAADTPAEESKDKQSPKSVVLGRPISLALENADGTPSFLEKALIFLEEHGAKVEGILRQAADVEDVESRIREFGQGKNEFSPNEDAHVIADCFKYILRESPSSPVPASCCTALLKAHRTDRSKRTAAMRSAICETLPESNCRLLQRILAMMKIVVSHEDVNRMNTSAVAACMAPLLLRPLLAGDSELQKDSNMGGDNSVQLLQAAVAATHAQSIVTTLLEEYDNIFGPDHVHISKAAGPMSDEVKDVKHEPTSTNNHAPQSDSVRSSTNSKRQGSKAEGNTSVHNRLSKLTSRLTFLREKRTQITSENQNHDKGRSQVQNSEGHSSEKYKGSDHTSDRDVSTEGSSVQNTDRDRRSEAHGIPNLERGKSENMDKNPHVAPASTLSR